MDLENKGVEFDYELSKDVYSTYIDNEVGYNDICKACKKYAIKKGRHIVNGPIPIFHIGKDYSKDSNKRILFLGTVAYGWEVLQDSFFVDNIEIRRANMENTIHTIENRIFDLYHNIGTAEESKKMKYFSFIKQCTEEIYGADGYSQIAISNLLKCNTGEKRNGNLQKTFDYCIDKNKTGNLHKDIEILKPTHVVILSSNKKKYWRYAEQIEAGGIKIKMIPHPSSSTYGGFKKGISDILEFVDG